jgi:hypothetical protein
MQRPAQTQSAQRSSRKQRNKPFQKIHRKVYFLFLGESAPRFQSRILFFFLKEKEAKRIKKRAVLSPCQCER